MIDDLLLELSKATGMGRNDVRRVVATAPRRYKLYHIEKRGGGKRLIAHPARELKLLQRAFLDLVLNKLPVHQCATAYREGYSLMDNALPHAENGPILKMDLQEFFPSIRGKDWTIFCKDKFIFSNPVDIDASANLLFRRGKNETVLRLSIGAPTSPALSNILMYRFDEKIFEAASEQYVTFTRYADDLTFSAPRAGYLIGIKTIVASTIRDIRFPRLNINDDKTKLITPKYHRDITGLTLANDGRVTVGQLRRRNVRAGIHNASQGKLSKQELRVLAGNIAFVMSVEPKFIGMLLEKYGNELLTAILKTTSSK